MRGSRRITRSTPRNADQRLIRIADRDSGVVSAGDLREAGVSATSAKRRRQRGTLIHVHRGVHALSTETLSLTGRFSAAVKACGSRACLSHQAGCVHLGYVEWVEGPIDVTVRSRGTRIHDGVRVHRSKLLTRSDLIVRQGILVTSPEWSLLTFASHAPEERLRSAMRRAMSKEQVSIRSLAALLSRVGPVRGSVNFARVLAQGFNPTRTELEDLVLDLILGAGFSPPDVNRPLTIDGRRLVPDFRWPDLNLIVEADSQEWHGDPIARADDLERQALLEASGERLIRVTADDVVLQPRQTIRRIELAGAPFSGRG